MKLPKTKSSFPSPLSILRDYSFHGIQAAPQSPQTVSPFLKVLLNTSAGVCRYVNNETQCKCDSGFTWNSAFCSKYQSCSVNNTGAGSCDCIRSEPTEGTYCELPSVTTTPTHSTVFTTTPAPVTATTLTTPYTVDPQREYELDVVLILTGNSTSDSVLKSHLESLLYPIQIPFENGTFNVTGITLTTVCRYVNNETQCKCDSGFTWNSAFCSKYQSCSVNNTGAGSCDCIRSEPKEGTYCELPSVTTTPTHSTESTSTPGNTTLTTMSTAPTMVSTTPPTTVTTAPITTVTTAPITTVTTAPTTTVTTAPITTVTTAPTTTVTTAPITTVTTAPTTMVKTTSTTTVTTATTATVTTTPSTTVTTTPSTTVTTTPTTTVTTTPTTTVTTTPTTTVKTTSTTTVKTTRLTTPDNLARQNYAIRVSGLTFTDELNNSSSSFYKSLSKEFKTLLERAYREVQPDAEVNILGFTKGSVIILYQVVSKKPLTSNEITTQIQNLSPKYTTELLPDDKIPCYDEIYGTANYNTTVEIPCENQPGVKKRRCGENGEYEKELDFCISEEINNILQALNLTTLKKTFSNLLEQLSNVTDEVNVNTLGNVQAVVTILTQISTVNATVNETDMENFLQTVNSVISSASVNTWKDLTNTQNEDNPNPSSQLLQSVENFNTRLKLQNDTLHIKEKNLEFRASRIHQNNNTPFHATFANFPLEKYSNLSANVFIPAEEIEDMSSNATVITIAYPTWIDILPNTTTFGGDFLINGLVVTITLNVKKPVNISMTFSPRNRTLDLNTAMCAFWDFSGNGAWNDTGCTPEINGENITCNCDHLTSFSILMSPDSIDDPALGYITIIGVAISIGCLVIAVIIEAAVWKHVTKNKTSYTRHVGILNIAVNLLVADIWFIVASAVTPGTGACIAATFFIHFFYLALFFWMLTLGLLLVYRLLFPFHNLSKSAMMGISFSIGYLSPLIISVITIGVTYPRDSYTREGACWLGWEKEYPLLAFVIPALVIIAINLIILIVVIFKLLRPTIGDKSRENNQERETFKQVVRSIAVLTPILGLTWAFGIPTFQKGSPKAFHYVFTILNAFQGFFILVFGTFMDKKVRESLLKKFSLSGFSSRTKTGQITSTSRISSKPKFLFPSRRKSYSLTQHLHSSDNDASQSFSTLS
ncbi:adhesion G-protein coupled receptor F1-like [Mustelus asterias]